MSLARVASPALCLLAACGSAGGTSADDGAAGATGGAAGAAAIVSPPDPGAPPAAVNGLFSFEKRQTSGGAFEVQGSALYTNPPQQLTTERRPAMLRFYDDVPLDGCKLIQPGLKLGGASPQLVKAGKVKIMAAGGVAEVPTNPLGLPGGALPLASWTPVTAYTLDVSGGAVGHVTGEFTTPGDLAVTSPEVDGAPLAVSRAAPLKVSWTGQPDGRPVWLHLNQGTTQLTCRASDTGAFEIPAATMAMLGPSQSPSGPSDEPDRLTVERYTWYVVGSGAGVTLVISTVHARRTLDVQ